MVAKCYSNISFPVATLLLQLIVQILIGLEIILRFPEGNVAFETMGLPFTSAICWLFGLNCVSYIHYPFVNLDTYATIQAFTIKSWYPVKYLIDRYNKLLECLYRVSLRLPSEIFANSIWTKKRLGNARKISILYPPCHIPVKFTTKSDQGPVSIISLGQFRPEKRQLQQLQIVSQLLHNYPKLSGKFHFYQIGGIRNEDDRNIYEHLKIYIQKHHLEMHVTIVPNATLEQKQRFLRDATIGLHTMIDEHFGISIVEMMVRIISDS